MFVKNLRSRCESFQARVRGGEGRGGRFNSRRLLGDPRSIPVRLDLGGF
jgi:hypothetical protein